MKLPFQHRRDSARRDLSGLLRDSRGSVTMIAAVGMLMLVGISAVAIDGGRYYYARRAQQAATDLAAIAAASDLTRSTSLATTSVVANGYPGSALLSVELGTFVADPAVAPAARFQPNPATPDSVRVTMRTRPPFLLGGAFRTMLGTLSASPGFTATAVAGFDVQTQAVASNQNLASFSLGTGLAQLDGGVENAVLGALLGSQIGLSVMDWQSLASARVDLFAFSRALATQAQLTGTTYGSVAAASVTAGQALSALADVLSASGSSAAQAVASLASASAGIVTVPVPVSSLISFGTFASTALSVSTPTTASLSAFDLVTAILQVANNNHQASGSISAPVSGISSMTFKIVVGEPQASSSLIAIGARGTTLRTAQTRIFLTLQLVGTGVASVVTLPLYVEMASGVARLSAIQCTAGSGAATLGVTPGVASGWIGAVTDAALTDLTVAPDPPPATLLNLLGLARVTGRAQASISNVNETAVTFSAAEISAGTRKTTSTTDYAASLYASLLGNLQLSVVALGSPLLFPIGLDGAVKQVLVGAATPVDQILGRVMSALGVSVGNATTQVSGTKCGRGTLVN